jgi:DNA segregation ATPase FtsK/SpoIIIE, S-DNA-T family
VATRTTRSPAKPARATAGGGRRPARKSSGSSAAKPAGKGRRAPTKAAAAARRSPKRPRNVGSALGGHGRDLAGLALVTAALVSGLAVYGGLAGPVGRSLADGAATGFGLVRYGLPVLLAAGGAWVLRRRPGQSPSRPAAGLVLVTVAACGLLHLARGGPGFDASLARVRGAGGVVGQSVGEPLRWALAGWGAAVVMAAAMGVGFLVLGRTTVKDSAGHASTWARGTGRLLRRVGRALAEVGATLVPAPRPAEPQGQGADEDLRPRREGPAVLVTGVVPPGSPPADGQVPPTPVVPPVVPAAAVPAAVLPAAVGPSVPPAVEQAPEPGPSEQLEIGLGPAAQPSPWKLPPLKLLERGEVHQVDRHLLEAEGRALEAALAAHGVETTLVGMTVGPTVTRFELSLGAGVKVARVTNLHKDIAYAMASADVRILAPIPGRSAIGVEVPNKARQLVLLGDILTSAEAARATHPLEVALGRDIAGRPILVNLAEMPHLLIAGATGSGKSSCINSLVTSLLVRSTPEQVRLILVDPKRVELGQYNGLPHLLTQVVVNPKKAANALSWAVHEMERRYDLLAEVGVRDITGYNAAYDRGDLGDGVQQSPDAESAYTRLPFVVIVVDELNDLMMVAARDVEESICRIAQMARAVGIHLVIATQRPSVDVITGVIKANIPSRLAFAVSSLADSRVILDQPGAERLIGQGDMLLAIASSNVPRRVQGSWVGEGEVHKVVAHWRRQASPQYVDGVEGEESTGGGGDPTGDDDEEHLEAAMELVVRSQLGSTSMLQRKLRVGFARAGRLMDLLERRGVVGPSEGSKARAVLMSPEELDELRSRSE